MTWVTTLLNVSAHAFGLGSSLDFLFPVQSEGEVVSPILLLVRSSQGRISFPGLLVKAASVMKISRAMEKLVLMLPKQKSGFRFNSGLFLIMDFFSLLLYFTVS